ncbi:MAG: GntR family transcriptional regulator [Verrucomicrobia bacterium]|nr:GntR family transcriptional regulator [Verrucomicrobiota bacterium]MCH8512187.1 GntR family transcriptional regulator [Kiritimatiellia bacterium]
MLPLRIDPHSGMPVYRQIRDQMTHLMASGTLRPGDRLPSIRELAGQLTLNPATVAKAYAELENEGAVVSERGKGVFVRETASRHGARERETILRHMLRQVWVEALQMKASPENLRNWFEEEGLNINPTLSRAEPPHTEENNANDETRN